MANESSSSELRHDWLSDRWVIIAPQRGERPDDFSGFRPTFTSARRQCPFCIGNEVATPISVAEYAHACAKDDVGRRWQVRVVPNKFPAVNGIESLRWMQEASFANQHPSDTNHAMPLVASATEPLDASTPIDLFARRIATGAHEVIIESPDHDVSYTQLEPANALLVFRAYRDRLKFWCECRDIEYAVLFKNVGYEAGASLIHPHSQLIATSILPSGIQRMVQRMELFYRQESQCIHCKMLESEILDTSRIVSRTRNFLAFCPFASRFPSQVTIAPTQHENSFEMLDDGRLSELANMVQTIVGSLEQAFPDAAYNYIIHTAPRIMRPSPFFHWRMEIFPRLVKVAGFEWGSECYINPLAPEAAAKQLRARIAAVN